MMASRQILELPQELVRAAPRAANKRGIKLHPEDMAPLVQIAHLGFDRLGLAVEQVLNLHRRRVEIVGMDDRLDSNTPQRQGAVPDNPSESIVDFQNAAVRRNERHGMARRLEGRAKDDILAVSALPDPRR